MQIIYQERRQYKLESKTQTEDGNARMRNLEN